MVDVFAPDLGFKVDRGQNAVPLSDLATGSVESKGVAEWDALTYGTRDLIRRVLQREGFQGSAQNILTGLLEACREQARRWNEPNPLARMREASGVDKLNWLDIAVGRKEKALPVDKDEGLTTLARLVDEYGRAGQHTTALLVLRTAVRRAPKDVRFRWATLAHEAAQGLAQGSKLPEAYKLLDLSTILSTMENGEDYSTARNALERAEAMLNKRPEVGEHALKATRALLARARLLATIQAASTRLSADLQDEPAEVALKVVVGDAREAVNLENSFLPAADPEHDPDVRCREAVDQLTKAIQEYRSKYGAFLLDAQERETLKSAQVDLLRVSQYRARLAQAGQLADQENDPPAWQTAVQYYDQAAQQYPDLWQKDSQANEAKRNELTTKLAGHFMDKARQIDDPAQAIQALSQSLYYQPHNPEALSMLGVPLALQRGLLALSVNDHQRAYQEFSTAKAASANTQPDVRGRASVLFDFTQKILSLKYTANTLQAAGAMGLQDLVHEMVKAAGLVKENREPTTIPEPLAAWDTKRTDQLEQLEKSYNEALKLLPGKLDTWLNGNPTVDAVYEMKQKLLQLGGPETLTKPLEQYSIPQRIKAGDFDEAVIQRLEEVLQQLKNSRQTKAGERKGG
jgi:hypothetical protein